MLGLVMSIVPFSISSYGNGEMVDAAFAENTSLAANGESAITVIKVSDDAPVQDSSPNTNFDDDSGAFNLDCSNWSGSITRSWLKFNLTHLPDNLHFTRATVNLFTVSSVGSADYPRGVYLSDNDTWTEETITWNNQPEYNAVPSAVIDSPESPDMFDVGYWYEWEITAEVIQAMEQDGVLTFVLSLVDEDASGDTNLAFSSREYGIILGDSGYNVIPHISIEYAVPTTTDLLVDGVSESPQIDYINSANPDFSWTFNDVDLDDFQKNYELEVWNNSAFDDTLLMQEKNSEVAVVHDTGGTGTSVADVFNAPFEVRSQYKWPSSLISQSGFVDKLFFEMDALSGTTTFSDLAIYMVSVDDSGDLTTDFQSNYDGRTPIQVLNRSEFTAITENGYIAFDIENTFVVHSSMNLIIEFRTTGSSGTSNSNFTDSGGSYASKIGGGAYYHSTADGVAARTQGLKLELVSYDVFSDGATTNSIPFGLNLGDSGRFQFKYNRSMIDDEGIIDKILFPAGRTGDVIYENFSVYLVETPLEGELSHTDMDSNYAGMTPTQVLSADEYVVRDAGGVLAIDVDDLFFYTKTHDLMIELRFDSFVGGDQRAVFQNGQGGYRAFDSTVFKGNDTATYNMLLEFIYDANSVEYDGSPLVNATTYYWRVRTYDSIGIWSPWESASFKYEVLESVPDWSNLSETASPIELGESMTISIDVTHTTEIAQVLLEFDGANHTMTKSGDTFSYTWIPDSVGAIAYTVYMEPYSGFWTTVSDNVAVEDTTAPAWVPAPADKVLLHGESLSYQLTATDLSGIASWTIDDTTNFEISNGLVTNKTPLAPGGYRLTVTVTDNEGNSNSASFIVAVLESTTTTSTAPTTPTQPSPTNDSIWIIAALAGVIVVLLIVIVFQNRKS
jgi:hypothetical protein